MRHYKRGRKLGTDSSHTKAIKKSLVTSLFTNDRIKTTLERAKEIRGDVDRVVTWAKKGDLHSRRLAIAALGNQQLVGEIFSKVEQGLFKDRPGGYSRILRLGQRRGDDAVIVIMELVQEPVVPKAAAADNKTSAAAPAGRRLPRIGRRSKATTGAAGAAGADSSDAAEAAEAAEPPAAEDGEALAAEDAEKLATGDAETMETSATDEAEELKTTVAAETEAAEAAAEAAEEAADGDQAVAAEVGTSSES